MAADVILSHFDTFFRLEWNLLVVYLSQLVLGNHIVKDSITHASLVRYASLCGLLIVACDWFLFSYWRH